VNILIIRRKSRYILIEASGDIDMSSKGTQAGLYDGMAMAIGHIGSLNIGPKIMCQVGPRTFILRVARGTEGTATLAIAFVKELEGREIGFYTIKTSGSIKKLKESALKMGMSVNNIRPMEGISRRAS
jgi:RNase P/RNase MRP subunit POP5